MRKYVLVPVLAVVALLGGCGLLSRPKTPPVNQYRIAPAVAKAQAVAATCALVILVRPVAASIPWATDNMLYTQTAHSIESYAFHEWAAAPATMLTDSIVQTLDARRLYRGVLGPLSPGNSDLTLAVTLTKGPLQVFNGAKASRETLALEANLTETESGNLITSKTFAAEQGAAPNSYGGVVATNALAGKLIGQILDWLAQTNTTLKSCTAE